MKDIDPMKLRGPECFAWAILNPGFKIKMPDWNPEEYMLWDKFDGFFKDERKIQCYNRADRGENWLPYVEPKPKPELITWCRPVAYWCHTNDHIDIGMEWWRCREDFLKEFKKHPKVLEWEEKKFPASYEDCE